MMAITVWVARSPVYWGDGPASLWCTGHFPIQKPIDTDDHAQAGEYLGMSGGGQAGHTEESLWVDPGVGAPAQVVEA